MAQTEFNENLIAEFRANGGEVTGMFAGRPLLLLTSTGAKTGKSRTTPLVYSKDGGRLVIIASMAGAPKHPAWFLNLSANPDVVVEVGTEKFEARAVTVDEPERGRLFAQQAEMMPAFDDYKAKTTRVIPVVTLERAG
jgi:deazaflavin-dependent oxidoreductase (nitroreductase family)